MSSHRRAPADQASAITSLNELISNMNAGDCPIGPSVGPSGAALRALGRARERRHSRGIAPPRPGRRDHRVHRNPSAPAIVPSIPVSRQAWPAGRRWRPAMPSQPLARAPRPKPADRHQAAAPTSAGMARTPHRPTLIPNAAVPGPGGSKRRDGTAVALSPSTMSENFWGPSDVR